MDRNKLIFRIITGLLSIMMVLSASMYFFQHDVIAETFDMLGYPGYIVYPLAVAKFLGVLALWLSPSKALKEWAYAGFFFDFVLAIAAHISVGDGQFIPSIIALILLAVSYFYYKKQN